jgi:protein required for attachment to host cells
MENVWILVAGRLGARVYSQTIATVPWSEVIEFPHPEGRLHTSKFVTDHAGRSYDSGGKARHAVLESGAIQDHEAVKFAHKITAYLEEQRAANQFASLVVVALPDFLGLLRQQSCDQLKALIHEEIHMDLTHLTALQIREHISTNPGVAHSAVLRAAPREPRYPPKEVDISRVER